MNVSNHDRLSGQAEAGAPAIVEVEHEVDVAIGLDGAGRADHALVGEAVAADDDRLADQGRAVGEGGLRHVFSVTPAATATQAEIPVSCHGRCYSGQVPTDAGRALQVASGPVPKPDIVDMEEVARRLGVKKETVRMWRYRDLLPEAEWMLNGQPVWRWATIRKWAQDTGRLPEEET
jgi:hypothetical protein